MAEEKSLVSDHTFRPDIFTASEQYATRFAGPIGEFFLQVQAQSVAKLLAKTPSKLKILEVGGGHGQLTQMLLEAGHHIQIQGSDSSSFRRVRLLKERYPAQLSLVEVPLETFAPEPAAYDVVLAFRLLAHVRDWRDFLSRMAYGARYQVILDIASLASFSIFTPMLFPIKKMIEGNTREYYCHFPKSVSTFFVNQGFPHIDTEKAFFLPMGIHRAIGNRDFSERTEGVARMCGLTAMFGSPCIISASR